MYKISCLRSHCNPCDLSSEVGHPHCRLVLGVRGHIAPLDVLDGDVLDIEANIVAWEGLGQGLVVHLHRLDLCGEVDRGEGDDHARLDDSGLHTTHRHCSDATDLVNVLEGKPEGLVGGPAGRDGGVEGLKEGHAIGLALLPLHGPALVPGHVLRGLDQ